VSNATSDFECRDQILAINLDLEFWMHPILYSPVAWTASRHETTSVCVALLQHPPTPLCLDLSSSHSPFSPPMDRPLTHLHPCLSPQGLPPLHRCPPVLYNFHSPALHLVSSRRQHAPPLGPFSCSSPSMTWSMKVEAAMAGEQTAVSCTLGGQRNLHSIQLQVWGLSPTFPIGWRPHP
jgi:hypothetical protein